MKMGKVAIVARVSTVDKQDYQRQINDLTTEILRHGYTTDDIEIFADKISGYSKNEDRVEFSRLLKSVTDYDCIYVTEISRLGRNPATVRKTIDEIDALRIPIFIQSLGRKTIDVSGKRDPIMQIIIQVLIEFANAESEQMKTRSKSGLLASAKMGRAGGGASLAYGYVRGENKMLVIEPNEAKVIKTIFQLYKKGEGIKAISNYLNENKIPTKSQLVHDNEKVFKYEQPKKVKDIKWTDKAVYGIIKNTLYKGERRFKNEILDAPAIISSVLFDQTQNIRQTKTHRNFETTYTYLLKDLLKCGCCGSNYFAKFKPTPTGDKVYICASRIKSKSSENKCTNSGVNISLIESAIFDQLIKSDRILPYLSQAKEIKEEMQFKLDRAESTLGTTIILVQQKEKDNQKLLDLYMSEIIPIEELDKRRKANEKAIGVQETRIESLRKTILELTTALEKNQDNNVSKQIILDAGDNRSELRTIFQQFIDKIIINDISKGVIFLSLYIKVNGIVLNKPLKIVLDKKSIQGKGKNKQYRYTTFTDMENEPVYKDDILLVDVTDLDEEIEGELNVKDWNQCKKILTVI